MANPHMYSFARQRRCIIILKCHTNIYFCFTLKLISWEVLKVSKFVVSFCDNNTLILMNKDFSPQNSSIFIFVIFFWVLSSLYFECVVSLCPADPLSALWLVQPNCWWDAELQDCVPCGCSPPGSMSQRCDVEGRCICRPGFVGRHCDLRRQGYERRETRRPVERVPLAAVHQRWGGSSRTGGCPRGAYRPSTGVTHRAWCV